MMRIAVCDDMPSDLRRLVSLTGQFLSLSGLDAEITEFVHPDALLTAIETESFHIYILDIVMPMVSGLELGKEIRRLDREAQIIYATTEPRFALQAYAASPVNYLIKPIDEQLLFDTLALAVSRADTADEQTFSIKTSDSLRVVKISSIACCEYGNHAAVFSIVGGEEILSRTFRENFTEYCVPILRDRRFVQCHTSFVINMRRVEKFSKDSFTLFGGKTVPIAAKRYPFVRDAYMDYLVMRGGN